MQADLCYALDPAEFVRGPVTARLCQLSTFVEASFVFAAFENKKLLCQAKLAIWKAKETLPNCWVSEMQHINLIFVDH